MKQVKIGEHNWIVEGAPNSKARKGRLRKIIRAEIITLLSLPSELCEDITIEQIETICSDARNYLNA